MAEERKDLELEAEEARASREADASVQPEADAGKPEERAKPGALESALYTWAQAAVIPCSACASPRKPGRAPPASHGSAAACR